MKNYILNIIKLFDNAVNVFLAPILNYIIDPDYRFGYYRDPLSEVFGRNRESCKFCFYICKMLYWIDNDHCKKSIVDD